MKNNILITKKKKKKTEEEMKRNKRTIENIDKKWKIKNTNRIKYSFLFHILFRFIWNLENQYCLSINHVNNAHYTGKKKFNDQCKLKNCHSSYSKQQLM
jgi:hypothetical protein